MINLKLRYEFFNIMSLNIEYLENIKSFKVYLENVVKAVESGRYHEDTIKKLSFLIKEYYDKIYEEGDNEIDEQEDENLEYSDVEFIDEESDSENDKKSIQSVNETNIASNSETSDSESDDEGQKTNVNDLISSLKSKNNENSPFDKYLEDFKSGQVDNSNLYINKDLKNYHENLQKFIENSYQY